MYKSSDEVTEGQWVKVQLVDFQMAYPVNKYKGLLSA